MKDAITLFALVALVLFAAILPSIIDVSCAYFEFSACRFVSFDPD